jgi:hypothetical protein
VETTSLGATEKDSDGSSTSSGSGSGSGNGVPMQPNHGVSLPTQTKSRITILTSDCLNRPLRSTRVNGGAVASAPARPPSPKTAKAASSTSKGALQA